MWKKIPFLYVFATFTHFIDKYILYNIFYISCAVAIVPHLPSRKVGVLKHYSTYSTTTVIIILQAQPIFFYANAVWGDATWLSHCIYLFSITFLLWTAFKIPHIYILLINYFNFSYSILPICNFIFFVSNQTFTFFSKFQKQATNIIKNNHTLILLYLFTNLQFIFNLFVYYYTFFLLLQNKYLYILLKIYYLPLIYIIYTFSQPGISTRDLCPVTPCANQNGGSILSFDQKRQIRNTGLLPTR